jgi:hypothetical protein
VERLGLGAGGLFLGPIANSLVREAHGQTAARKRLVFVIEGNGWNASSAVTPPDFAPPKGGGGAVAESTTFMMPPSVQTLAKYRNKLLFVDGLTNTQHEMGGHYGYSIGTTCMPMVGIAPSAKTEQGGIPGGISFDQHIANTIGKNNPFKSVDLGMVKAGVGPIVNWTFAYGREQPVPTVCSPTMAFMRVFKGAAPATPMSSQDGMLALQRKRFLFDAVRDDIKRVQTALAGRERQKLDEYLAGIGAIEERLTLLGQAGKGAGCSVAPVKDPGDAEGTLEVQFDIAAMALLCNMTQVVTIASGPGRSFDVGFERYAPGRGKHGLGHGGQNGDGPIILNKIHNFHGELIAKLADKLAATSEGGKSVLDNTMIIYTNDNGEAHHARHHRWPVLVLGNAGSALKTDGRFVRYPVLAGQRSPRTDAHRPLRDFYITLSHALGAPNDSFGQSSGGGYETAKSKGVLTEIL